MACGRLRLMGILTILCGVAMIVMGALSLIRRKSTLPELQPMESVVVLVPFGLIITVIGVIIQSKV
jgi:multisubunit Na+/H+ antiporter MnhG subunit